jgi:hypothetical protein
MADERSDYSGARDRRRRSSEVQHESDECITVTRVERRRSRVLYVTDEGAHPSIGDASGVGRVRRLGQSDSQRGAGDTTRVDDQARGRANAIRLSRGFINERNLKMFSWLLNRMKEPSTWAGLATIAVSLGHPGGATLIHTIAEIVIPLVGAVAVVMPERTSAGDR